MKNLVLCLVLMHSVHNARCQDVADDLSALVDPTLPDTIPNSSGEDAENGTTVLEGTEIDTEPQCVTGLYLPSSIDCSSFLVCDNGKLKDVICPPFMWFDPNYEGDTLCNYPEVVCAANNSVCDCAQQYPPLPPDPLVENDVSCMVDNRFHLSGSKVDCGRYFICYNDNVYRQECRSGFHYNAKTEMCDYPELVNCKITDPDCPDDGISFLAHPSRVDAFYFCIHGFKTMQTCPFYHVWDLASVSCRRRDEI